ncbi:MAG: malto-oligosyltrehalose synthase, partial [Chloroflexi bacterium]|nr:malto-oligosyltrehalose synthase [Chloroflexota bacterium]
MMVLELDALNEVLDELMQPPRIPRATYRIQFSPNFTFQDALALVDYLDMLGASDLYASPLFKPRPGSTHGYDTVDYNQFNPALGTEGDFDALAEALKARGMGVLLDVVPNHMGVSTENLWWTDILKQGPSSEYAYYFDVAWRPHNRALDDRVLLPILGDHYGRVLEAGEINLVYWHGDFYLHYYEHQFPVTPDAYGKILTLARDAMPELHPSEAWVMTELASIIHSLNYLPSYHTYDEEARTTRRREQLIVRWRVLGLFDQSEVFRNTLQATLDTINGDPEDPTSFDVLDDLLDQQPYRLAYWRVARDEINYRRFFDINDLAAVRIEDERVFNDVNRLALRLLAQGKVIGLRVDHPDGLWDPEAYFWRLQQGYLRAAVAERLGADAENAPLVDARLEMLHQSGPELAEWLVYVLVEKILSSTEPMPNSWAVYGTTGYDFMYTVNNLFVDPAKESAIDAVYTEFIGEVVDFTRLTDYTKKLVMTQSLTSEIDARSAELARIVENNRRYRDYTQNSLAFGLSELIAALEIYRTYITGPGDVSERDRMYIEAAAERAKNRNPMIPGSLFDFLRDILLMQNFQEFSEDQRASLREFVMKFQQITGPVMAKSVEDTAFYIYNRLSSLNEVGGHPDHFGTDVASFHQHNLEKLYPHTMLSTSTHDTKRSEDVRARINVLAEMPEQWGQMLTAWAAINANARTPVDDIIAPARNDEYLLYQTLIGVYDAGADEDGSLQQRVITYMHKAINEAKTHSNWVNPNEPYAQAITDFVERIWVNPDFRESFDPFQQRVAYFGWFNALSQTLLKLTSPGVPDIYQGNEVWDYSLVDPDNRRPIDFEHRRALLEQLRADEAQDRLHLAQ